MFNSAASICICWPNKKSLRHCGNTLFRALQRQSYWKACVRTPKVLLTLRCKTSDCSRKSRSASWCQQLKCAAWPPAKEKLTFFSQLIEHARLVGCRSCLRSLRKQTHSTNRAHMVSHLNPVPIDLKSTFAQQSKVAL